MRVKRVALVSLAVLSTLALGRIADATHSLSGIHWSTEAHPKVRTLVVEDGLVMSLARDDRRPYRKMRNRLLVHLSQSGVFALSLREVEPVACFDITTSPDHPGPNILQLCTGSMSDTHDFDGDGHIDGSQVGTPWPFNAGWLCRYVGRGLGLVDRADTGPSCMASTSYRVFDEHDLAVLHELHDHTDEEVAP